MQDTPYAFFQKAKSTTTSMGKLALIGLLMAVLLIPMSMVKSLIQERQSRRGEAEREVAGKWGGNQLLGGPILTVPYRTYSTNDNGKTDTLAQYAYFLPEELDVLGILIPEVRSRGIFEFPLFQADLEITGRFTRPSFAAWKVKDEDVLWDEAYLTFSMPDLRSVVEAQPVEWLGKGRALSPDNLPGRPVYGGLQAAAPLGTANGQSPQGGYPFKVKVKLNGSGSMRFLPMGKRTQVTVRSPWTAPSYSGAFLPDSRSANAAGFQADWTTLSLSRSFPQTWRNSEITQTDWEPFAFGVDLILPVDGYQKAERCAKYAVLFILLTFLVFFLYETFDRTRIHPLQYLLVGFALCIFYLLLLSLSEHIGFGPAYAAAAAAVVALITTYGAAILGARKRALGLMAMLTGLYGYLYTLLQMEDYALLMGSLGLFLILGAVMFTTRKVNWYGGRPGEGESKAGFRLGRRRRRNCGGGDMNGFLRKWKEYFEVNAALPDGIPWSGRDRLSEVEKRWMGPSVAAFQLGESSDGKGLQAAAEACGRERGWVHLGAVTRFFIREEQNHAALLGRFLDLNGMPRLSKEWTDRVFRLLRRGMGLRCILPVLLTAEILALVYYRALAASTGSGMLKALCRKILADEMAHVAYESVLLGAIRKDGRGLRVHLKGLEQAAHLLLYGLTLNVVYRRHREVLKRGGYPYRVFRRAAWEEFHRVMDPRVLAAPVIPEPGSWEDRDEETGNLLRWDPLPEGILL